MARPGVALAIVDTDDHVLAANAVRHSMARFEFAQALIFSDRREPWGGLPVIDTPRLGSIEQYNRLVTRELAEHLRCDHVIVMQFDGFVLNPHEFSPLFRHYDYIGAPWPGPGEHNVGNGGFSWRSRRLVDAVARLDYANPGEPEDLFIARSRRPQLEAAGCRYAPREIAAHFSVEFPAVPWPTFGFHGIFHLPGVYREAIDFLVEHLSDRVVAGRLAYLMPGVRRVSAAAAERLQERHDRLVAERARAAPAAAGEDTATRHRLPASASA